MTDNTNPMTKTRLIVGCHWNSVSRNVEFSLMYFGLETSVLGGLVVAGCREKLAGSFPVCDVDL